MALIVQKFGGTSVGDVNRIQNVAKRVIRSVNEGHQVVVVVSAMAGETNRLIGLAKQITADPDEREFDQIISTGEQVTIGLLALALKEAGQPACSFLGHQVQIKTDANNARARIQSIDQSRILKELNLDKVVVVAGFQGIDDQGNITTLGRGGSDTTAVALAAALKADLCEIYTDVDGIYTTDPRICEKARKIKRISYEEALEMASQGAKVLQMRSVVFAAKYNVPLVVRSSFDNQPGTEIVKEEKPMEDVAVSGVTLNQDESKITIRGLPDQPGIAAKVFTPIAKAGINVDMIVQNKSLDGHTDLTFTVPGSDALKAQKIIQDQKKAIGIGNIEDVAPIAKVSVIGVGMRSHAGVAAKVFENLSKAAINIQMISTSEIRVSVVIDRDQGADAVRLLHEVFKLDEVPH